MVLPVIIAGGAYLVFGKELLIKLFGKNSGEKLFKQTITLIIILSIGIIGYFIYQIYKAKEKAKETIEETIEKGWEWVLDVKEDFTDWSEEGAEARKQAIERLDPYLGIKSGISETSLEAKQYAAGQKVREDILNAPSYYWNKLWGK